MTGGGSSSAHTALVRQILARFGAMPGLLLGANPCGVASYLAETGTEFRVSYGWPGPGGPDVLGVGRGRFFGLECKTGKAVRSKEQRACAEALEAAGIHVYVVRSIDDAKSAIEFVLGAPIASGLFDRLTERKR